ncbi:MAG: glycosyltransferase family 2 protein [Pseudoruegeria sp.]
MEPPHEGDSVTLVTSAHNEGQFLVEWVAFHSRLGFKKIIVVSNHCEDGSLALLDRMDALGYITHERLAKDAEAGDRNAAVAQIWNQDTIRDTDWMLSLGVDQFLNLAPEFRTIRDLIASVGEADAILLLRRLFGNSYISRWSGGSVMKQFIKTQTKVLPKIAVYQAIFRISRFNKAEWHLPKLPTPGKVIAKSSLGVRLNADAFDLEGDSTSMIDESQMTFERASLNHYAVKSDDFYMIQNSDDRNLESPEKLLKNRLHRRNNRNQKTDLSILARLEDFETKMSELRADSEICRLEEQCQSWFYQQRHDLLNEGEIEDQNIQSLPIIRFHRAS